MVARPRTRAERRRGCSTSGGSRRPSAGCARRPTEGTPGSCSRSCRTLAPRGAPRKPANRTFFGLDPDHVARKLSSSDHPDSRDCMEYIKPEIVDYGDLAELTAGTSSGNYLDANFSAGTERGALT